MRCGPWVFLVIVLVGSMLASGRSSAADFVLVEDGRPRAAIVYPAALKPPGGDPNGQEQDRRKRRSLVEGRNKAAAERLQQYLRQATGVALPLVPDEQPPAGNLVLVGDTARTRRAGIRLDTLPGDSFLIRVVGNHLILGGCDETFPEPPFYPVKDGTSYAVSTFLEDYCGVRWFMPGKVGEDVLPLGTISVPGDLDRAEQASIALRMLKADNQWRSNNKVGLSLFVFSHGGHTWNDLVPTGKWEKTHPEYYALVQGRRASQIEKGHDASLCTGNPAVLETAVATVRQSFDAGYDVFQLGHPDSFGSDVRACECPACMAIGDASPAGLSGRVYRFHMEIAREVRKTHPDKRVQFMVYGPTATPPPDFEGFPDNVLAEIASPAEDKLKFWSAFVKNPQVYVYNWTTHNALGVGPKSSLRRITQEMDRYHRYNVQGIYWCGSNNNWGLNGVQYWLAAKLMWNTRLDPQRLLDDYFARFYRDAAGPMKDFFVLLDERSSIRVERQAGAPEASSGEWYLAQFPPDVLQRMAGLLSAARRDAAADALALRRIGLTEKCFAWLRLTADCFRFEKSYSERLTIEELTALKEAVASRADFIKAVLAEQEKGAFRDFVDVFIPTGRPFPDEVLYGAQSSFAGPFRLPFDQMLTFLRTHETPRLDLTSTDTPPVVDGKADDACWRTARPLAFVDNRNGSVAEAATEAFLAYDGRALYAMFRCREPKIARLQAPPERVESKVWLADCVELFLSPDRGGDRYYHLMLSWDGLTYDARKGFIEDPLDPLVFKEDVRWSPRWEAKTSVDTDGQVWLAEMAIPFDQIGGLPAQGAVWRVNLARERWVGEPRGPWDPKEIVAWSPTFRALALPSRFGFVTFR